MAVLTYQEQAELRRMCRDFFTDVSAERSVREVMASASGLDARVWSAMAELGLTGLTIPEEFGGGAASVAEVAVVMEEAGRRVLCAPLLSSVVATEVLVACVEDAPDVAGPLLAAIAEGTAHVSVAHAEPPDGWAVTASVAAMADSDSSGWRLSGSKHLVPDGMISDWFIVSAMTSGGLGLFVVPVDPARVRRVPMPTLDQTRRLSSVEFVDAPATILVGAAQGTEVLARAFDVGCVALAAEQVGGAQVVLDMSVAYATSRVQFGRPIGSFQAIKHFCADMLVDVELARSLAYHAAEELGRRHGERAAVRMAQAYCADAFYRCASTAIQVHGGIGFTWEHWAHLYLKRAKSGQHLFGRPRAHRQALAHELGFVAM